ncbi:hypothetical protein ASD28_18760 [Massilia sp. Root133]|uniref:Uncharacterized protein n=1 Tax=Massilia cellulosiltytica TaxID=2683234 RepID=A0A7X3G324_9BURK|nr:MULTISPECIES: hypothetical protein [Telluria group]KQX95497.1 hypothetical protein ASD28_18760 [Massilia sp. Root133]MVW62709.1 hypothetical protein [Telluria cellulosilytica]
MKHNHVKIVCLIVCAAVSPVTCAAKAKSPVEEAKAAVKEILKDPASAQFKNIKVNTVGDVCGQFNAKNSFGGYGDYENFRYEVKDKKLTNVEVQRLEEEIAQEKKMRYEPGFTDPDFEKFKAMKEKISKKFEVIKKIDGCALE